MRAKRFYDCTLSEKLMYTSFLLLVGLGYLMAIAFLYVSHEMNDKQPGISMADITTSYYGNRSGTRLESAIRGPMSGYLSDTDRDQLVAWLKDGAGEDHFEGTIKPIMEKHCLACHSKASGMPLIDYSTYAGLHQVAQVDTGMSIGSLLRLSHIHLFGISLLLFALGIIFVQTEVNVWFKRFLIVSPVAGVFTDVLSWFLTKYDSNFGVVVIISGAVLGFSMAAQILISLYQIWFLKKPDEPVIHGPLA